MTDISVATYNVLAQCFVEPERYATVSPTSLLSPDHRRQALIDKISTLDTTLILLQEVEAELLADLQTHLGRRYRIFWSKRPTHSDGCAVLVSQKQMAVLNHETLVYRARETGYSQVACLVTVQYGETALLVVSTHLRCGCQALPGHPPLGQLQMRELLDVIRQQRPRLCILGGDLNALPDSPTLQAAYAADFRRAGDEDTAYIRGVRGKRDYLLHRGVSLKAHPGVGFTQLPALNQPSDHVAFSARLLLPG
ncbi:MAG: endonuclease/exonuclease/phosphatase family protein [Myxococcota bacterium]